MAKQARYSFGWISTSVDYAEIPDDFKGEFKPDDIAYGRHVLAADWFINGVSFSAYILLDTREMEIRFPGGHWHTANSPANGDIDGDLHEYVESSLRHRVETLGCAYTNLSPMERELLARVISTGGMTIGLSRGSAREIKKVERASKRLHELGLIETPDKPLATTKATPTGHKLNKALNT